MKEIFFISIFSLFFWFSITVHIHWFNPYRTFKHSSW